MNSISVILVSMQKQPPYPAPDFSLQDDNGDERTLKDFAGSWLVVYFYPKDDTPGCTIQACSLRDARDDLQELGAKVVGVSKDDINSHDAFKAKHSLNFSLLSDSSGNAIRDYGVWDEQAFNSTLRKTFIIDPEGVVQKVYDDVVVEGHGQTVVSDIKKLMKA